MQNLIYICENRDADLWASIATQATKLPPEAISTEPMGTDLPHGLSWVFFSLLEKDMMMAKTFHTSYMVAVWATPVRGQWL